jgi:hypothetical protein
MRVNAIGAVLAVNVVLAGALAFLWSDDGRSRWSEPAALPPSLEDVVTAPPSEPADVSRYRETLERPLFAASRRMAPRAEAGAEAQAADSLKDVRLLGTYGSGERGGIIVMRDGQVQRVAVGESIGGWKVAAGGQERSAELVRASGERRQLELTLNSETPAAPAASAADREGTPAAAAAPGAEKPRAAAAGQARTSRGASSGARNPYSREAREERQRQRLERANERRAQQGRAPATK